MSFWRTKNSKKITSDSIAVDSDGTTLKDYCETKTNYALTNTPIQPAGTSNTISIKKVGKTVFLNVFIIYFSSISANTNLTIGTMPSEVRPSENLVCTGLLVDTSGNNRNYGRIVIRADGNITLNVATAYSSTSGVRFSATWIQD